MPQSLLSDEGTETPGVRAAGRRWTVVAHQSVSYDVESVDGLLTPENPVLADRTGGPGARRFLVVDEQVDRLHGARLRAYLAAHGGHHHIVVMPTSERAKNMDAVHAIVRELDAWGIDRRSEPIIAVGGGVLLDIVGLAAQLYRRGTPYLRVPTTLIGIVDAGVGAKTGVNHGGHKNRLGAYFAPSAALLDRAFLVTLDRRHLVNGMAEILKIALIKDRALFELLEEYGDSLIVEAFQGDTLAGESAAVEVLDRAIRGMLDELAPNLWEQHLERVVDYGHSLSPTLEMLALPELLHGEAVAVDMALSTVVAARRGLVGDADRHRVLATMRMLGLPVWHPLLERPSLITKALADTVRHRGGLQRMPLPVGIGAACFANDVHEGEFLGAAEELRELESQHA